MTYTPEQLKQKTDDEINEIAAVVCMGWDADEDRDCYIDDNLRYAMDLTGWQPCSPTEAGKAQCWDLMVKFGLNADLNDGRCVGYWGSDDQMHYVDGDQKAVCIAAILSAQGER